MMKKSELFFMLWITLTLLAFFILGYLLGGK